MNENPRFSPENIRLLDRLAAPKTFYTKWRRSFLRAGKMSIIDDFGIYSRDHFREDLSPFEDITPNAGSTGVRTAGPERDETLNHITEAADLSILNTAHLLQEGGIIITSQNPPTGTVLQFGLTDAIRNGLDTQDRGFSQLSVGEVLNKGIKLPAIQDYDTNSQVISIDPNILGHIKKVGIWLPGIRRQAKLFDQNGATVDIAALKEALTIYIDSSLTNINPPPPSTAWRKLRNEQAEVVLRHRVAVDIIEAFFGNIPESLKG